MGYYTGTPFRLGTTQTVAYTGTHGVITNAVSANVVRVWLTTAGYIAIGTAPVATTSDIPMPANTPEYFIVGPGDKVSAIQASAGGNLYVTACSR